MWSYILRSRCLSLKLARVRECERLGIALCGQVSHAPWSRIVQGNKPPVCCFFSFLSLDLRCGLCTWSSMVARAVLHGLPRSITSSKPRPVAFKISMVSWENLSDKAIRH
jgi:hypothetical protein